MYIIKNMIQQLRGFNGILIIGLLYKLKYNIEKNGVYKKYSFIERLLKRYVRFMENNNNNINNY